MSLREDAKTIYTEAIEACLPDNAVARALETLPEFDGRLILVSIGKAAYRMGRAAAEILGDKIDCGIILTKYGHSAEPVLGLEICEAAHPVPDGNGLAATKKILDMTGNLNSDDMVLFLVSGGGSALFEYVDFPLCELEDLTKEMLASGASITEMNTVRKHLSLVKGGRFAEHVYPARIYSVVLSDIIGSPLDMIASGPCVPDLTSAEDAIRIVEKYSLSLTYAQRELLKKETPKTLGNVITKVSGSVSELCEAAKKSAERLGYRSFVITDTMDTEARCAGELIGSAARKLSETAAEPTAYIFGGETVVHLRGSGLGGRNQELALAAAEYIKGKNNVAVFSVGSDGTDGPTDAAGGYVDGETAMLLPDAKDYLDNNDSYSALLRTEGLIFTGATGTNVNDFAAILIK